MDRGHERTLKARLEEAATQGCAHIASAELHQWYQVKKLAAATWRDLADRWEEAVDAAKLYQPSFEDPGELMSINGKAGIFIFGEKRVERVRPS
jgi:hypothetical protein